MTLGPFTSLCSSNSLISVSLEGKGPLIHHWGLPPLHMTGWAWWLWMWALEGLSWAKIPAPWLWVLQPLWSHFAHLVILCSSWLHSHSAEVITALFTCEQTPSKDLSSRAGAGSKEKMHRLKKVMGLSQEEELYILDILERDVKSGVGLDLWPKQLHRCLLWKERENNQSVS